MSSKENLLDRVADVAGESSKMLQEMASMMHRLGYYRHAIRCNELANKNREIVFDCLIETQPISE